MFKRQLACIVCLLCLFSLGGVAWGQATLTIEEAIASLVPNDPDNAANADLVVGDREIRQAVQLWITTTAVPRTGGQTINDQTIQRLVGLWISGQPVSVQPGPPPGRPGFSIQGAIIGAKPGGVVLIPEGTYRENVQIDRAITLISDGQVLIQGQPGNPTIQVNINVKGVTLRGLQIQGGASGVLLMGSSQATLEDSTISDNIVGIKLINRADLLASRNRIFAQAQAGVEADSGAHATLLNNTIEGNGSDGVLIQNDASAQLSNNTIQQNQSSGVRIL